MYFSAVLTVPQASRPTASPLEITRDATPQ